MSERRTLEEIDRGLIALALSASISQAAKETGLPQSTLRDLRNRHPDRFYELRTTYVPAMQKRLAAEIEDNAIAMHRKIGAAVEKIDVKALEGGELGKVVQQLSISSGIAIEKARLLRDQPTVITDSRSADDILRSIARRVPNLVVDSTAEEVPPKELEAGKP